MRDDVAEVLDALPIDLRRQRPDVAGDTICRFAEDFEIAQDRIDHDLPLLKPS